MHGDVSVCTTNEAVQLITPTRYLLIAAKPGFVHVYKEGDRNLAIQYYCRQGAIRAESMRQHRD